MKKLILFVIFLFSASFFSQKYYDQQWKKIEDNYKNGIFKSNLPIILEIQKQAMKDKNAKELIRSLKAELEIVNQTADDENNDTASRFFSKVSTIGNTLKGDNKLLYETLIGKYLSDYQKRNRWKINLRNNIDNQDFEQIETWSNLDFKNYLSRYFEDFRSKKNDLKKIKLSDYESIFSDTEYVDYYPTLQDWHATNEMDFLENSRMFTPKERQENHTKINEIYDELINENSGNAKLYFQHRKLNYNCKNTPCKGKFSQLENLYKSQTEGDYKVLIIEEMAEVLTSEQKFAEALRWMKIAEKEYPKSKFLVNLKNKEKAITNPYLSIKHEKNVLANLPIHFVAEAKNINSFSLKIYELKNNYTDFLKYINNPYNKQISRSLAKTLVKEQTYNLENKKDYKTYKTALEIQPLPSGIYIAEYAVNGVVQGDFYFVASQSRIIHHHKNEENPRENILKLVNRNNGVAIANEELKIYEYQQANIIKTTTEKTDASALFQLPISGGKDYYRYYLIHQPKTNDFNLMQTSIERFSEKLDVENKAQIFLDRAIYRPGQLVYFKVINTQLKNENENVLAGVSQQISLHDANGQELASQRFTTNEFGSYHGNFVLPKGKLNGQFYIKINEKNTDGYKVFRVEEYKRPKFEVTFEPIKGEYRYGQTIELKGKAMAFSGVALSNVSVNYEIKKQNIRWRYFWWHSPSNDNENSILGEVKTNDKGEFIIRVDLQKDETLQGIQVDNFQIHASVTDINGETQSATENVRVASVSHYIKTDEPKDTFTDENVLLNVKLRNYNEQILHLPYQIKLSKIDEDERVFRNNFRDEVQNLPKYTKAEFVQKFPHDRFNNDDLEANRTAKVMEEKTIAPDKNNELNLGKLSAGKYKIELYNIEGKDTIKAERTFEVFQRKSLLPAQKPFLKVVQPKTEFQRGETAKVYVYSAIPNALINIFVQNGNGKTQTEQKPLKNGALEYEIEIPKEENISLLNLQFQLVAYNDVQTESVNLNIASSEKPLRIETVTFRDKLQPNQKEKWTVKILGKDNEKINAEMLANMYDMSLDKFSANRYHWQNIYQNFITINYYNIYHNLHEEYYTPRIEYVGIERVRIPYFNWFDGLLRNQYSSVPFSRAMSANMKRVEIASVAEVESYDVALGSQVAPAVKTLAKTELSPPEEEQEMENIPIRENLNETAFFYPNLFTDKDGNISFEFTSPEALTKWKLMLLAHTKDARAAILEKEMVTQKEFSVSPNYPRFLREDDEINLQTKLSSLVSQKLNGTAQLQILDAQTNQDISEKFGLKNARQTFQLDENANTVIHWKLKTPKDISATIIKTIATAKSATTGGSFSDGEQKAIAVLPNRILVTDAQPIFVKEGQTKTFTLKNLAENQSETATNVAHTLELTTNPIWEIMLALPSLKNNDNHSADVVFNKWFADVLAAEIYRTNPKLKTIFEQYQDAELLKSNLDKNQELKQLLLEETPWILNSKNETEQMENIARLFQPNTMGNAIRQSWDDLQKLQNSDGGFSWHEGYPSSYQTSLYILKNLGKINEWLKDNLANYQAENQQKMVANLVGFVDREMEKYQWQNDNRTIWDNSVLDYLDARHYWESAFPMKGKGATLKQRILQNAAKANLQNFTFFGLHRTAILLDAYGEKTVSKKLMNYLKETSTQSETQGIYWKQNQNHWGWYFPKTINHAGALEAFQKLTPNDVNTIEELKIWLVTQKEVNAWGNSRATAEVIFTILNSGKSWTANDGKPAEIIWGGTPLSQLKNANQKAEGYVKTTIPSETIRKDLATVTVTKSNPGIVQGGVFWQYYEDLDKVKSSETQLSITKEWYKKIKTENGEELRKITAETPLKIGDRVTVRMILNTDRDMEFIHLKDMRAAGFEPLETLSGYKWQQNLGYYQSTKDASTNFYIQYMPKGKYVFEYDYICNAAGTFSGGITTLQNYYAPQMNAHTQGAKLTISE